MAYRASRKNEPTTERDQTNAEEEKHAADVAQHSANPYVKTAGTVVNVGDKLTGGRVSNKLGSVLSNSPIERISRRADNSNMLERLRKNNPINNPNNQAKENEENVENSGGDKKESSPSSGTKKEERSSSDAKADSRPSNKDEKDDKSSNGDSKIKTRVRRRLIIIAIALVGILLFVLVIISAISTLLGALGVFDDALGISSFTGGSTGNTNYTVTSQDQADFYQRVSDVEMDFLSKGQKVDSLKIVAVYHILKENGAKISYSTMTESDIRDIASSMLNGGIYDEATFKKNLQNSIIPQYLPNSTVQERRNMANGVLKYVDNYYEFINEEPPSTYNNCVSSGSCTYDIKGYYIGGKGNLTQNIQVSDLYVRLMQCGTANGHNYGGTFGQPLAGEELVPFEKYILGVAYQEIGTGAPAEAIKAQMVAARSYILARHADMGGWRTLKKESGKWILQAASCTQDQVYCNPDKGCSASDGQWGQVYSGQGHAGKLSKNPLPQSSPLRTYANQTSGEVLTNSKGYIVYSGYTQTEQTKMISLANQGFSYKQILLQIYNQGSRNYGATAITKAACSSGSSVNCGSSTGAFASWKQAGASWSNVRMGNSGRTIGQIGCLVTSISMLIVKSGVQTTIANFNPGTFVQFLNNNGGFDGYGNLQYGPISKAAPSFRWVDQIDISGMSREQKLNTIRNYQNQGYYMAAEVATSGQHWVAIDSVNGNSIKIMDPGSNVTDLWGSGKYTPQSTRTLNIFRVG